MLENTDVSYITLCKTRVLQYHSEPPETGARNKWANWQTKFVVKELVQYCQSLGFIMRLKKKKETQYTIFSQMQDAFSLNLVLKYLRTSYFCVWSA